MALSKKAYTGLTVAGLAVGGFFLLRWYQRQRIREMPALPIEPSPAVLPTDTLMPGTIGPAIQGIIQKGTDLFQMTAGGLVPIDPGTVATIPPPMPVDDFDKSDRPTKKFPVSAGAPLPRVEFGTGMRFHIHEYSNGKKKLVQRNRLEALLPAAICWNGQIIPTPTEKGAGEGRKEALQDLVDIGMAKGWLVEKKPGLWQTTYSKKPIRLNREDAATQVKKNIIVQTSQTGQCCC